jgi:hypothetical protein
LGWNDRKLSQETLPLLALRCRRTAAPVNLQESDTGAVLLVEGRRRSYTEETSRPATKSNSKSNLQVFNSVAAQKEGRHYRGLHRQQMSPSDPSIFTIKLFTTPWRRPYHGHVED